MPVLRKIAKQYTQLTLLQIEKLLKSKIHEHRFVALVIVTSQYKAKESQKEIIVNFFLKNSQYINNWDLVDCFTPNILGDYLKDKKRNLLYKLAKSKSLWERRMAILATLAFIRKNDFIDALAICEILINDQHDLIHKATGWMLREIGKRDQAVEEMFLKKFYKRMPRVMLRYAIERFDDKTRKHYLKN